MSTVQMLRALVKQRLTAAAEDIFGLFERTIAEYEETLCRSKEENERQRRLLDAVFNPQLRLHRADVQQLLVITEEVPPEHRQEEWSPSLEQEDPPEPPHIKEEQEEVQTGQDVDPPHIKEEQEEVWTCQEGEQLQGLEEVKVEEEEDDEEKPQSSQLHEQMETEADEEDCGGPEPAGRSHPDTYLIPDTKDQAEDCFEGEDNGRYNSCEKQLSCSVCSKQFNKTSNLKTHMRTHTGEKPFSCSVCGKKFAQKPHLQKHFRSHTGEKPFSCSVCGKRFAQNGHLQNHFRCHTGEKPFSCSLCDKCFSRYEHLQLHMRTHTGEKPVSCKVCDKRFTWPCQLRTHNCVGNPSGYNSCKRVLKCSVCGRQFNKTSNLKRHMSTHLNRWKQKLMERTVEDQNQPGTHIQIGFSDMDRLGPIVDTEVFDTDRV